jgi:proline iminopeptidase
MTDWTYREWAWAETFVLIGHSYGGFVALDYAVNYPDRLRGLVLIDTWASGALGAMTALSYVLTSQRSKVDRARQVRFWSGTTLSDQDCRDAIGEMLPIDTPPEEGSSETAPSGTGDHQLFSTSAEFWGPRSRFRSVTHNWAFGQNLPRYDVRQRLDLIKVSICPVPSTFLV